MHFVLLWKTWFDGKINTPWDFILVEHTNDWKSRGQIGSEPVSPSIVEEIMSSMDPQRISRFETDHIHGLILSALIEAENTGKAINLVHVSFPDAEIMKCVPVLDHMLSTVKDMYKGPGD